MHEISVIIPVHNGARVIGLTVNKLLKQRNVDFEILLIENFSSDESAKTCDELMNQHENVRTYHCHKRGTSQARKLGVQKSEGEYIVFCDQDDHYINNDALYNILNTCKSHDLDICQFGRYTEYAPGIRKKKRFNLKPDFALLGKKELLEKQIKGVLGFGWSKEIYLSSSVWDKCYHSQVIKEAVENIGTQELYYNEDSFLNSFVFFSPSVNRVGISDHSYYVWITGGVSSKPESSYIYMRDLEHSKAAQIKLIRDAGCGPELENQCYWDTLTVWQWTVFSWIGGKVNKSDIIKWINEIESFQCVSEAKKVLGEKKDILEKLP